MALKRVSILAAGILALTSCGQGPEQASIAKPADDAAAIVVVSDSVGPALPAEVTLADGVTPVLNVGGDLVDSIRTMAADDHDGAWAWLAGPKGARLVHLTSAGVETSISVPGEFGSSAPMPQALAVCDGQVWAGIGRQVVRFDQAGRAHAIDLPDSQPIPGIDAHRPPELRGLAQVSHLACADSGVLAGLTNSADAFAITDAADTIRPIPLPAGHQLTALASAADGSAVLAVQEPGTDGGQLLYRDPQGNLEPGQSRTTANLLSNGNGYVTGNARLTVTGADAGSIDEVAGRPSALLPNGDIATTADNGGLHVVAPDGTVREVAIGSVDQCGFGPSVMPVGPEPQPRTSTECPLGAKTVVAAPDGSVYVAVAAAVDPRIVRVQL